MITPNPYKDYLVRKYGYETEAIDLDGGFLLYRIHGEECNIGEIYVPQGRRQAGIATKMADKCAEMARSRGCKYLSCQTQITGNDDELSMLAILHYGFKPLRAENNAIVYIKELI